MKKFILFLAIFLVAALPGGGTGGTAFESE